MLLIVALMATALYVRGEDTFEVARFYDKRELPRDSKVIDSYDNVKDARAVLLPTEIDEGTYDVKVTRIDSNFYKVEVGYNDEFYVETKYCYRSAYRSKAVLIVNGRYDYKKGKLVFR